MCDPQLFLTIESAILHFNWKYQHHYTDDYEIHMLITYSYFHAPYSRFLNDFQFSQVTKIAICVTEKYYRNHTLVNWIVPGTKIVWK